MEKRRKMKNKDEKSCMNVAVLFRHESRRFFCRSAAYCCHSSGKPRRKFMLLPFYGFWLSRNCFSGGEVGMLRVVFIPGNPRRGTLKRRGFGAGF